MEETPAAELRRLMAEHQLQLPVIEPLPDWLMLWLAQHEVKWSNCDTLQEMLNRPEDWFWEPFVLKD